MLGLCMSVIRQRPCGKKARKGKAGLVLFSSLYCSKYQTKSGFFKAIIMSLFRLTYGAVAKQTVSEIYDVGVRRFSYFRLDR